jgi:imidazole glycerol-phosphate synthase subunit HisH
MIALIDYGAGNVRSVLKALETVGAGVRVATTPNTVRSAAKVVLPGVGAFADCMSALRRLGMTEAIYEAVHSGKPFLGICVGMQVLFDSGEEQGRHEGLGILSGRVVRFTHTGLKIPHTGWNQLILRRNHLLFQNLPANSWAYFNHAYHCEAQSSDILAVTDYGGHFDSAVGRDNVLGIQFHPEKSQTAGLRILRNFVEGTL